MKRAVILLTCIVTFFVCSSSAPKEVLAKKNLISSSGDMYYNGNGAFNFKLDSYFTDGSFETGTLEVNVTVTYYQVHLGQRQVTFDMQIYYYYDFGQMYYAGEQDEIVAGSTASFGSYTINSITPEN